MHIKHSYHSFIIIIINITFTMLLKNLCNKFNELFCSCCFILQVNSSELMQRSVLGQLLPEAMVYYLENHGAEKFAQIFLGEYDTPEAIWNSEMR